MRIVIGILLLLLILLNGFFALSELAVVSSRRARLQQYAEEGRQVRRALQSAVGYRFVGVTRLDVVQGTAKAQQARDVMGELPEDILAGTSRAPYAPALAIAAAPAATDSIHLRPLPDLT